jgi:hypothetical protein
LLLDTKRNAAYQPKDMPARPATSPSEIPKPTPPSSVSVPRPWLRRLPATNPFLPRKHRRRWRYHSRPSWPVPICPFWGIPIQTPPSSTKGHAGPRGSRIDAGGAFTCSRENRSFTTTLWASFASASPAQSKSRVLQRCPKARTCAWNTARRPRSSASPGATQSPATGLARLSGLPLPLVGKSNPSSGRPRPRPSPDISREACSELQNVAPLADVRERVRNVSN